MDFNLALLSQTKKRTISNLLLMGGLSVLFGLFSQPASAATDYAIFSLNSEFKPLSRSKARMLYRGKMKSLQGQRIELADWPHRSTERELFYQSLLGKDIAQMNAYWASLSFSGKARPPKEISSAEMGSLVIWLQEKPNRVGYAPLESLPSHANILYVLAVE